MKSVEEKTVVCLTCGETVTVKLIRYGYGKVGICPECGKLAYSGE